MARTITLEDLLKARKVLAEATTKLDEKYFPLFERIDDEVKARTTRTDRLKEALKHVA